MKCLDLTFATPQENLACDEALLDWCENGNGDEVIRFWESPTHFVVVGYSNKIRTEANLAACERDEIPVLRRCTGGGAVLQGPGCLNYTLILRIPKTGPLAHLTSTNRFVMEHHRDALATTLQTCGSGISFDRLRTGSTANPSVVAVRGTTDLVIGERKFSGNAQRRKRRCLIFHGTFLHHFNLALVEKYLLMPARQPDYRHNRAHNEFLTNIPLEPRQVREALVHCWDADAALTDVPQETIHRLAADRYSSREWTFKF
jgi:lipoate---protein ligase